MKSTAFEDVSRSLLSASTPNKTETLLTSSKNEGLSTEILFAAYQIRQQRQPVYGVTLKNQLLEQTGKEYSFGAIYTALARMQSKGFFSSALGESTKARGGKRKRYYELTELGQVELRLRLKSKHRMWEESDKTLFSC